MCFDVKEVQEAIDQVVDDIGRNPFIIHNETDIHAMLYSRLIDKHNKTYPINLKYRNEPVNQHFAPLRNILNYFSLVLA